jgi:hypothetical protein
MHDKQIIEMKLLAAGRQQGLAEAAAVAPVAPMAVG